MTLVCLICAARMRMLGAVDDAQTGSAAPKISDVAVSAVSPTSVLVQWITDVNSDTMVSYGVDDSWEWDQGYTQDCAASTRYYPACNGSGATSGVTAHSIMLSSLRPGSTYNFGVRSRGFTNGLPDPSKAAFDNVHCSGGCRFTTPAAPSTGAFDYYVSLQGPQHVTQGYAVYVQIRMGELQGTSSDTNIKVDFAGLPANATLDFPDADIGNCAQRRISATRLNIYRANCGSTYFKLSTASSTPIGAKTLTLTFTALGGVPAIKILAWPITVDAATPLSKGTPSSYPPIPCLSPSSRQMDKGRSCSWNWTTNMITYGTKWCVPGSPGNNGGPGNEQGAWYYDGERVYFEIHEYDLKRGLTRNPGRWNTCASDWASYYSAYVIASDGRIPGFRVFPHGPYMDFLRNGSSSDKAIVDSLATKSAYSGLGNAGANSDLIREIAYLVQANRLDNDLGASRSSPLAKAVDMTLGNVDQNVVSQNADYVQPFMLGLAAEALIQYYEDGHASDVRIPAAVKHIADWLWINAWNKISISGHVFRNAFYYNNYYLKIGASGSDQRNLNLLVCPLYAWLFQYTGDAAYQAEGDQCWQAGVNFDPSEGIGWSGKNFTQNYRWSFDYVTWRSAPGNSPGYSPSRDNQEFWHDRRPRE